MQQIESSEKNNSYCYYCNKSYEENDKIMASHTFSKNSLKRLQGKGSSLFEVSKIRELTYQEDRKDNKDEKKLNRSPEKASTGYLFCSKHEKLFHEIENRMWKSCPYDKNEEIAAPYKYRMHIFKWFEQSDEKIKNSFPFLLSYRFLCLEHYHLRNKIDEKKSKCIKANIKANERLSEHRYFLDDFLSSLELGINDTDQFNDFIYNTENDEERLKKLEQTIKSCNYNICNSNYFGNYLLLFLTLPSDVDCKYCYSLVLEDTVGSFCVEYLYPINERDSFFVIQSFSEKNNVFIGRVLNLLSSLSSREKIDLDFLVSSFSSDNAFCKSNWEKDNKVYQEISKKHIDGLLNVLKTSSSEEDLIAKLNVAIKNLKEQLNERSDSSEIYSIWVRLDGENNFA